MNCVRQEKDGVVYFTFPSFTEEGLCTWIFYQNRWCHPLVRSAV